MLRPITSSTAKSKAQVKAILAAMRVLNVESHTILIQGMEDKFGNLSKDFYALRDWIRNQPDVASTHDCLNRIDIWRRTK